MPDTWHVANDKDNSECLHCTEGPNGGHYACSEAEPCQDCIDDALYAAENIAAGWGAHGEEPNNWEEY